MKRIKLLSLFLVLGHYIVLAQTSTITIDATIQKARVSPNLHGIFFEEISHGGDGGLYTELIQNRGFEESKVPEGCTLDSGFIIPPRKLLMSYKKPREVFAIGGLDENTGEIIIKIVNIQAKTATMNINLKKAVVENQVKVLTLSSGSSDDENSFENPTQFTPQTELLEVGGSTFNYVAKPWSITILRMRERK